MNTSKHTPGPWKWTIESHNNEWAIVTDQNGHIIANVNSESGPDIPPLVSTKMPMETNAHLIAAAPAMYEALQRLFNGNVDCGTYWQIDVSDIQAAKQALAQAEGK